MLDSFPRLLAARRALRQALLSSVLPFKLYSACPPSSAKEACTSGGSAMFLELLLVLATFVASCWAGWQFSQYYFTSSNTQVRQTGVLASACGQCSRWRLRSPQSVPDGHSLSPVSCSSRTMYALPLDAVRQALHVHAARPGRSGPRRVHGLACTAA